MEEVLLEVEELMYSKSVDELKQALKDLDLASESEEADQKVREK